MGSVRPGTLSAGTVVVRDTDDGPRLLMLRCYGYWDFPKGVVEGGEAPVDAAVRETAEESGIVDLAFDWGAAFVETEPYGRNKVARYYLARSASEQVTLPVNPELGRPEHHEYRWVDLAQARRLAAPRLQRVVDWVARQLDAG